MADDPVSQSLEDDTPPAPAAAAAAPVTEVAPDPAEDPGDVEVVEVAGRKLAPIAAVIAERKGRQAAETKAARADQLEAWVTQNKPYIDFLQANPDLLKPRPPEPVPHAPDPTDDPDAVEAAQLMDFYTPEGKPDVARGARYLAMQDKRSQRQAAAAVQPLMAQSAQERSLVNYQRALASRTPDGRAPHKETLDALWRALPPQMTADPNVVSFVTLAALGSDVMTQRPGVPAAPNPPLVTEGAGGTGRGRASLTPLEQAVAANRGTSEAKWQEQTKGFRAGRASTLEDE